MTDALFCILLFVLLIIIVFVCCLSLVAIYFFISSSFMRYPPPVPSSGRLKEKMLADIYAYLETQDSMTFMDLGSGWGSLLIPLAKKFPQHHFIGVEHAFLPYIISVFRSRKLSNIKLEHNDIFKTNISQIDIFFCFLMQNLMNDLTPYLRKNMKKGAYVYSCRFICPNWQPEKSFSFGSAYETYYIYRKN